MASILDERRSVESPTKNNRIEWRSTEKAFCFYKKSEKEGEKGETIALQNIEFIPVLSAFRIGGYSDPKGSFIWSNTVETDKAKEKPLKVRYQKNNELIAEGLYPDIKEVVKAKDGAYNLVLYSLLVAANGKPVTPARKVEIIISGSSSMGMSESGIKFWHAIGNKIVVAGALEMKKGSVKYNAPKFVQINLVREQLPPESIQFAKDVKEFLSQWDKEEKPVETAKPEKEQEARDFHNTLYDAPVVTTTPSVFHESDESKSFPSLADEPPLITEDLPF